VVEVVSLVLGVVDDEAEELGVVAALPVMPGLVLVVPFEDELVEPIELLLLLEGLLPAVVVSLCGVVLELPVAELPVEVP